MLKFLIITVCIFFLIRLFSRMFVVSSFNAINKKMQDEMQRRQNAGQSQKMPEGHISIDPSVKKQQRKDDDDYVDYEEVK